MRKILILSLLVALFAVSARAETTTADQYEVELSKFIRFSAYAIQSFGWKCNEVQSWDYGSIEIGTRGIPGTYNTYKIMCEDNLTYYARETGRAKADNKRFTFCHKGVCKKFE